MAINDDVKKANLPKSKGPKFLEIKTPINNIKTPLIQLFRKLKIILSFTIVFILKFV